ncbi:hypothetical protein AB0M39_33545 [Streptomyces sp. NPDC051907]|uniref:hypothetical protein n=1 Tax=Streptomyces sp. NPDC051907 TaxID=3155284 RepID=UPI00342F4873
MRQRVRLLLSAALPSVLFGVWATFLVLVGAAPAAAGASVATAPSASVRVDAPQRSAQPRTEVRRATAAAQIVATDGAVSPPTELPALPGPVPPRAPWPVHGGDAAQPRQERAPPCDAYDPRHTRAPPSTQHS